MGKKRAVIGFKGVTLLPLTANTAVAYKSDATNKVSVPYAGSMSRTAKETTQDIYYDDDLYAQVKEYQGDDVEVRFGEIALDVLQDLGLGTYDETTQTLEANFNVTGKEYSFRCKADTVDRLPNYFNWRVFELTGIRYDNFATKGSSLTVCEVIMTGVFKRPALESAKPYVIKQPKDDGSDLAACDTWLGTAETLPAAGG